MKYRTLVAALLLALISLGCAQALAEPEPEHPSHAARPTAGASVPAAISGADHPGEVIEFKEGERRAEWIQGVLDAEEAQRVADLARRPVRASSGGGVGGSCNGDVECFLACTRAHESDTAGGYGAVSPGGTYRGAYQFLQSTWDAAVAGAGWAEYAGMPPDQAPAWVQDAAAAHLYGIKGTQPWGGRC